MEEDKVILGLKLFIKIFTHNVQNSIKKLRNETKQHDKKIEKQQRNRVSR